MIIENDSLFQRNEELSRIHSNMELKLKSQVDRVKTDCISKIDELKVHYQFAEEEISKCNIEKSLLTDEITSLKLSLDVVDENNIVLLEKNDEMVETINKLREQLMQIENELDDAISDRAELKSEYDSLQETMADKLLKFEEYEIGTLERERQLLEVDELAKNKIITLQEEIETLKSLIGPFRSQLEQYDIENKSLQSTQMLAVDEAKEVSAKYAQLLGHQNTKQKIKHVVKLKEENLALKMKMKNLEANCAKQLSQIQNLKQELTKNKKSLKHNLSSNSSMLDKENVLSPLNKKNNSYLLH